MPKYKINNRLAGHEKKTKNYGGAGGKSDFKKNIQTFSPGLSKRLPPACVFTGLFLPCRDRPCMISEERVIVASALGCL